MKVVIFAGGYGTRLSEETIAKPKPIVEIGGLPIIVHIMKYYSFYGHSHFVILGGYKISLIKNYFKDYMFNSSETVSINLIDNSISFKNKKKENWIIDIVDTGENVMTGSRLLRGQKYIGDETFALTYGDGLSNINLEKLKDKHKKNKKDLTLSAVMPKARYGALKLDKNNNVTKFIEKPVDEAGWVNGGYMICNPEVLNLIDDSENCVFETDILPQLAYKNKIGAYKHHGFWQPMDTLRDKNFLEDLYKSGNAPWVK